MCECWICNLGKNICSQFVGYKICELLTVSLESAINFCLVGLWISEPSSTGQRFVHFSSVSVSVCSVYFETGVLRIIEEYSIFYILLMTFLNILPFYFMLPFLLLSSCLFIPSCFLLDWLRFLCPLLKFTLMIWKHILQSPIFYWLNLNPLLFNLRLIIGHRANQELSPLAHFNLPFCPPFATSQVEIIWLDYGFKLFI